MKRLQFLALATTVSCTFGGSPVTTGADADAGIDSAIDAATDAFVPPGDPLLSCKGIDPTVPAQTILADGADLVTAVAEANAGDIIHLSEGTYIVDSAITVTTDDITIRGIDPFDPAKVRIETGEPIDIFEVEASGFSVGNLTLSGGRRHFRVSGSESADESGFLVTNIVSLDPMFHAVLVDGYNTFHTPQSMDRFSHDGIIACSKFSPSPVSCINQTGVLLDKSDRWRVTKNRFNNYNCQNSFALRVVDGRDPVIDRNQLRGYSNGIRVGRFQDLPTPACDASGDEWAVLHGVVCNNDLYDDAIGGAHAISFAQACDTVSVHNTVYQLPGQGAFAIDVAETNSHVFVANNLSNVDVRSSEGGVIAPGLDGTNQFDAPDSAFANPAAGLLTPIAGETQPGSDLTTIATRLQQFCSSDLLGRERDIAAPAFVGAYEL